MPNGRKISQFPAAAGINNADVVGGVQNGVSTKFSFATIFLWLKSVLIPSDIGAIPATEKGAPLGVAELDSNGKVPSSQLDLSGKQDTITASGILKGDGTGGVSAATAGTDYGTYSKPSGGIPSTDMTSAVQTSLGKADTAYQKPSGGIPASDIASGAIPTVPSAYTSNPSMDGTASPGSTGEWADGGHVHPSDTSKANQAQLATVESGSTASRAYAVGEYFCWQGILYRATAAISNGGSFTPGTNCEVVTVGGELQSLASTMKSFEVAHGHSLQISIPNNATRLQCLLASSGARTTTSILYFLSLYSTNSNYHIINPIVTGSSISVSDSAGTTTITNNHASDTVTFIVLTLSSTGTVNYTVV